MWVLSLQVIVEWLDLKIKWISLIKITLSSHPGLFEINVMIHWYVLLFLCRLDWSRSSALYFLVAMVNPRIGAPLMTTLFHYSCTLWAQTKHTQGRLKKLRFSGKCWIEVWLRFLNLRSGSTLFTYFVLPSVWLNTCEINEWSDLELSSSFTNY